MNIKYYKYLRTLFIVVLLTYFNITNYGGCCGKCCCKKNTNSSTGGNTSSEIPLIDNPDINNINQNINNINTDIKNINNNNNSTEANNNKLKNEINTIKDIDTINEKPLNGKKIKKHYKKKKDKIISKDTSNINSKISTNQEKINEIYIQNNDINNINNELNINNTSEDLSNTNLVIKNIDTNNINIKENTTTNINKNNDNINNNINVENNIKNINPLLNNFNPLYPQMNNSIPNPNANINSIQFNNIFMNQNQKSNNIPGNLQGNMLGNMQNNMPGKMQGNNPGNIPDNNNNMNMNMNMPENLNPAGFPSINNFIPNPNANINSIQFNNNFINQNQQLNNNPGNLQGKMQGNIPGNITGNIPGNNPGNNPGNMQGIITNNNNPGTIQGNMLVNLNPASLPSINNFIPNPNANINSIQFNNSFINQNQQLNNNPAPIPNHQLHEPLKPISPIQSYSKPTLIGLNNIGSTCYKNAVLQCLSQTAGLTNYFLKDKNKERIYKNNIALKNPQELQLSVIYYELIQKLWDKKATYKSYSPNNFMNSLAIMTQNDQVQFKLYEAGDAKDFIIYILETMHKELRKAIGKKTKFDSSNPQDELNQYDKNNALNHFMNEFQNETSIISDLFYGFNETTNVCQFCKMNYNSQGKPEPICYNYGIFNILVFPLNEVLAYRKQMMKSNNSNLNLGNWANVVNIIECFYYNEKDDYFQGDNKNYCNICRQLWDSVYTSRIFVSPNILIIILNRGKGNQFNIKLDFTMQIDITDFVLVKNSREIYNLYGVITHLGQSGPNAHFVAACKSPVDGNWYRYNDAIVTSINNFQNDILNFGTPYILFYEKQK